MIDRMTEAAIARALRDVARAEVLPRFRRLAPDAVATKSGPEDLVTIADRAAEARLTEIFATIFPEAQVIGEEAVSDDPAILGQLYGPGLKIVLDPIDGTANFVHGNATFGMIVALVEAGETLFGMLYDPLGDDWIVAGRGAGAWFVKEGARRRLALRGGRHLANAKGFLPLYLFPPATRPALAALYPQVGRMQSLRCSCHEYRLLAMGHADFGVGHVSKPWDHAAGQLAIVEAGGVAGRLAGGPYDVTEPDDRLVAAGDPALRATVSKMVMEALGTVTIDGVELPKD